MMLVDADDRTPLHLAVLENDAKLVTQMMAACDAEKRDVDGRTALHLAAEMGDLDVIGRLLHGKAKVSAKDKMGWRPLHVAVVYDREDAVKEFIGDNKKAANFRDCNGQMPLHLAAKRSSSKEVLKHLITDVNIDMKDDHGYTPLCLAVLANCSKSVETLLAANADAGVPTKDGRTALDLALEFDYAKIADTLMARKRPRTC
jgi:ankyrin repeat protein